MEIKFYYTINQDISMIDLRPYSSIVTDGAVLCCLHSGPIRRGPPCLLLPSKLLCAALVPCFVQAPLILLDVVPPPICVPVFFVVSCLVLHCLHKVVADSSSQVTRRSHAMFLHFFCNLSGFHFLPPRTLFHLVSPRVFIFGYVQ